MRWPVSSLLNVVYAVLVEGADQKGKDKLNAQLDKPLEGSREARMAERRARFELAQQVGAT